MNNFARIAADAVVMACTLFGCVVAPPIARATMPDVAVAPPPMYFYPAHGQDDPRQQRDHYECYRWAMGQSGFDPAMTPVTLPPHAPTIAAPREGCAAPAGTNFNFRSSQ